MGGGGREQKYSKPVGIMPLIRKKGGRDKTRMTKFDLESYLE